MLTQLSTLKTRMSVVGDTDDAMLNRVLESVSVRFERFCNRQFGRVADATEEFSGDVSEIAVPSYPVESVSLFEIKDSEAAGWQEVAPAPDYLVRRGCVISLAERLGSRRQTCRVTYTGGYVLPGDEVKPGRIALPEDIEDACVEQVASWYLNRSKLGLLSVTADGQTTAFVQSELLTSVQTTLRRYVRFQA